MKQYCRMIVRSIFLHGSLVVFDWRSSESIRQRRQMMEREEEEWIIVQGYRRHICYYYVFWHHTDDRSQYVETWRSCAVHAAPIGRFATKTRILQQSRASGMDWQTGSQQLQQQQSSSTTGEEGGTQHDLIPYTGRLLVAELLFTYEADLEGPQGEVRNNASYWSMSNMSL